MKNFFKSFFSSEENEDEKKKKDLDYKYLPKKDEYIEERFTKKFSEMEVNFCMHLIKMNVKVFFKKS